MEEITIKVPGPFAGVGDLGFTARYPRQDPYAPAQDVPFLIEGPANPMRRLCERLRLLRQREQREYTWTDPVMLSDEVVVMAFRDQSLAGSGFEDGQEAARGYLANWVRPVIFPFLHDCAAIGGLRLSEQIEVRVQGAQKIAEFNFRLEQIVQPNGREMLWSF